MEINPKSSFLLPDGIISFRAGIHDVGPVRLEAESKYNFINSDIDYRIRYSLPLGRSLLGGSLYDALDFEEVFSESRFINRRRGGALEWGYPVTKTIRYSAEVGTEQHFFVPFAAPGGGTQSWILNRFTSQLSSSSMKINGGRETGRTWIFRVTRALPELQGSFDFLKLDLYGRQVFGLTQGLDLVVTSTYTQFPFARPVLGGPAVPSFEQTRLGGYQNLRGFRVQEFAGSEHIFGRTELRLAYPGKLPKPILKVKWVRFELLMSMDVGAVGKKLWATNFKTIKGIRLYRGMAVGARFHFSFKEKRKIELTFLRGQALEPGRRPVFYFVYTLR